MMKFEVSWSVALGILLTASATDAQATFGSAISFELTHGHIVIAPSSEQVAVISKFGGALYRISDDGENWLGPFEFNEGYYGTQVQPTRLSELPAYGWTVEPDGTEVFIINRVAGRAVAVSQNKIANLTASGDIDAPVFDKGTGRLWKPLPGKEKDYFETITKFYEDLRGRDPNLPGFVSRDAIRSEFLPINFIGLADVSPQGDQILFRQTEAEPLVCLNMRTGERVDFPIRNDRPRALPGDMSGSFSPDGAYVLMQYSYSPDDHYAGGYLQLFTREGDFVEEVAEFHKDVGLPVGFHEWLSNGWLVYSTGKELVFRKFISE